MPCFVELEFRVHSITVHSSNKPAAVKGNGASMVCGEIRVLFSSGGVFMAVAIKGTDTQQEFLDTSQTGKKEKPHQVQIAE